VDPTTSAAKAAIPPTLKALKERYPKKDPALLEGFAKRIDELEKAHGDCAWIVTSDNKLVVMRRPTLDEWEEHGARVREQTPQTTGLVQRQLGLACVVEPSADLLPALFQRWPGLVPRCSDAVQRLAGAEEELVVKKE
jgi:hypothetical protein